MGRDRESVSVWLASRRLVRTGLSVWLAAASPSSVQLRGCAREGKLTLTGRSSETKERRRAVDMRGGVALGDSDGGGGGDKDELHRPGSCSVVGEQMWMVESREGCEGAEPVSFVAERPYAIVLWNVRSRSITRRGGQSQERSRDGLNTQAWPSPPLTPWTTHTSYRPLVHLRTPSSPTRRRSSGGTTRCQAQRPRRRRRRSSLPSRSCRSPRSPRWTSTACSWSARRARG